MLEYVLITGVCVGFFQTLSVLLLSLTIWW